MRWWNSKTHLHLQIRSVFVSQRMALDYSLVRSSPNSATSHAKKYIYILRVILFSRDELKCQTSSATLLWIGWIGGVGTGKKKRALDMRGRVKPQQTAMRYSDALALCTTQTPPQKTLFPREPSALNPHEVQSLTVNSLEEGGGGDL